jgi:hypothetical protein
MVVAERWDEGDSGAGTVLNEMLDMMQAKALTTFDTEYVVVLRAHENCV